MNMANKATFAPIPQRAVGDNRLSASHWRLLAGIASYDRFGKNQRGCYASHKTLSSVANVDQTNIPRLAHDLAVWGYIVAKRSEHDRRLQTYSVLYTEPKLTGETTSVSVDAITGEITSELPHVLGKVAGEIAAQLPKFTGDDEKISQSIQRDISPKYIPLNGTKEILLNGRYSVETATPQNFEASFDEMFGAYAGKHITLAGQWEPELDPDDLADPKNKKVVLQDERPCPAPGSNVERPRSAIPVLKSEDAELAAKRADLCVSVSNAKAKLGWPPSRLASRLGLTREIINGFLIGQCHLSGAAINDTTTKVETLMQELGKCPRANPPAASSAIMSVQSRGN
jgi:hypothetical protein